MISGDRQRARVALYGAGGAPYHHAAIFARGGAEVGFVFPADIAAGALDGFDAFVMPGGGYRAMQGQLDPLGASGCRAIRRYVEGGGMYIGCCAGSYLGATAPARFRRRCPEQSELSLLDAEIWNQTDDGLFGLQSPGIGQLIAENVAPTHPVMAGISSTFAITHYNGPLFTGGDALARVRGKTEAFTPSERFRGGSAPGLLIDRAATAGAANIVAGRRGEGRVVLFGSHPEFGISVALDDLTDAARLLTNAVSWQVGERPTDRGPRRALFADAPIAREVVAGDAARLAGIVDRVTERCAVLHELGQGSPWLAPDISMSLLGRAPAELWAEGLRRIPRLAAEVGAAATELPAARLSFRPPTAWAIDGGFLGVVPLLERAEAQLARASDRLATPPVAAAGPYDDVFVNPYHLATGSYLSAVGTVASAALLCRATASEHGLVGV